jgi:hypothetical protein
VESSLWKRLWTCRETDYLNDVCKEAVPVPGQETETGTKRIVMSVICVYRSTFTCICSRRYRKLCGSLSVLQRQSDTKFLSSWLASFVQGN